MQIERNNLMRWLFSGVFAAVAIWSLSTGVGAVLRSRLDGWTTMTFISFFSLIFAAPFALAAYFCFTRQYRNLFTVGAVVAALFLLSLSFTIPRQLGMFESRNWKGQEPWQQLVMLAISLLLLVGPFYLVGWFLRVCSQFAAHRILNGPPASDA